MCTSRRFTERRTAGAAELRMPVAGTISPARPAARKNPRRESDDFIFSGTPVGEVVWAEDANFTVEMPVRAHFCVQRKSLSTAVTLRSFDPGSFSQRYAALPGNEVVLIERVGLGFRIPVGDVNNIVEYFLTHLFDGAFSGNNRTGIDVNDVRHAAGEL